MPGRTPCCPLGRRGYSRDGKRGKLQIEFGLLCDAEGRPVAVERIPRRNTADAGHRANVAASYKRQAPLRVLQGGVGGRPRDVDRGLRIRRGRFEAGGSGLGLARCGVRRCGRWWSPARCSSRCSYEKDLVEIRSDAYPGERLIRVQRATSADIGSRSAARKRDELLHALDRARPCSSPSSFGFIASARSGA